MISAFVLALASVMPLLAGVKMIVRRACSPLKAVHRRNLTPEGERRLSLVCGPALLVVGTSFAASAYLAAFARDAAGGAQAVIGDPAWGQGHATELTHVLLGWAQVAGKDVVIECVPEQVATRRIAKRFGFSLVGERDGLIVFRRLCT